MTIYIVSTGNYSDWSIDSLWSTKEKAEERISVIKVKAYWRALENIKKALERWDGKEGISNSTLDYYRKEIVRLENMQSFNYDRCDVNEIDEFELDDEEDLKLLVPLTKEK